MEHTTDIVAWLNRGIVGRNHVTPEAWVYWHARLMVVAWTICIPVGAISARFFKILPKQDWPRQLDSKFWWRSHTSLIPIGMAVMMVGLALAYMHAIVLSPAEGLHRILGWTVFACAFVQIASGLLRGKKGGPTDVVMRGDHYDMSTRRIFFEYFHKTFGWLVILLASAETYLGLCMVNAPRWMVGLITLWWILFWVSFSILQVSGFCVDTYQAIWGTDPIHPGNRRAPIGWGVHRTTSSVIKLKR